MKMHESGGTTKYPIHEDGCMHLDDRSISDTYTVRMHNAAEASVLALGTAVSGRRHFGMKRAVIVQKSSGTGCGLGLIQEICARLHQEA